MVLSMRRAEVVRDYGGVSAADRRAERRRRLPAAGRRIWGESGITEVTVRGVCKAAGLIPRYFYEHFPNRDALLFAVADDVRDELLGALVAAGTGTPAPSRTNCARRSARFSTSSPPIPISIASPRATSPAFRG